VHQQRRGKAGILATAIFIDTTDNNRAYHGTMVSFQMGQHGKRDSSSGTVFNAASINRVTAVSQEPGLWNSADQITRNVFNRLARRSVVITGHGPPEHLPCGSGQIPLQTWARS
jgi:hypothetical protein